MSSKGQLVVPQGIRLQAGLEPTDRFISMPIKDGVVFKKIKMPDLKKEFDSLSKDIQIQFKKQGITKDDLDEAVKWARK